MSKRLLESIGLAAVILAMIVLLKLVSPSVEGQGQAPKAQPSAAAKTSWGEPDLEGI